MLIQFFKRIVICVCLLSFSLPIFAQKKYTEKDLAALKQTLMQSVAGKSKDVQVMVDQIFSFAELGLSLIHI
jgi:aminobenzoyl-glutamate utilization protein B